MTSPCTLPSPREARFADLGELAGVLTHEFNSVLNNLSLQLALLEQQSPQSVGDFQSLRGKLRLLASQIMHFQRYPSAVEAPAPIDLNQAIQDAVARICREPLDDSMGLPLCIKVQGDDAVQASDLILTLQLDSALSRVTAYAGDLARLCRFLLRNAALAAREGNRTVCVRTQRDGSHAVLTIEDGGRNIEEAMLTHLWEPQAALREGTCSLELAACRSIVRRLEGKLEAAGRAEGGVAVSVRLPLVVT